MRQTWQQNKNKNWYILAEVADFLVIFIQQSTVCVIETIVFLHTLNFFKVKLPS